MKKNRLPVFLFRIAAGLPLVLMFAALGLAYAQIAKDDSPAAALRQGTLNADVSWKVRLKDNPFYPTRDLGSDYAYIRELVDYIQFDLQLALHDAPEGMPVKIAYRVDGVLQANQDTGSNGLLLLQDYPKLAGDTQDYAGPSFSDTRKFQLPLASYIQTIESFQSAYHIAVTSKLDLNITVDVIMDSDGGKTISSMPLKLTIPLDSSVFQLSGSPDNKMELNRAQQSIAPEADLGSGTLLYLAAACAMLLLSIGVFVFFSPRTPGPELTMLKQAIQKCRGKMVVIKADPRDSGAVPLPVSDISGLISISEGGGQPVLYLQKEDAHIFLVSSEGLL